jgi:CheY-like chemotaxis protein
VAAGRAAGMDGHLTKPVRRALLLEELARLLPAG